MGGRGGKEKEGEVEERKEGRKEGSEREREKWDGCKGIKKDKHENRRKEVK